MPHDGVGARAIAGWLVDAGVHELLVVHDHDDGYGVPVGVMCAEAARERGLAVRSRPVWDHDESPADDIGDAQAVLYVGVAGGSDRAATVRAARSTRDRDSVLGRYSIDERGHTTCTKYGCYAVADGELVWDRSGAPRT
jgi:hypothetical protein